MYEVFAHPWLFPLLSIYDQEFISISSNDHEDRDNFLNNSFIILNILYINSLSQRIYILQLGGNRKVG